jgi:hypothetical protein
MPYTLIRHKVEDYARWKPVFDEDAPNREASGSKGGYLLYGQTDELREKMQRAGVADRPDFYFLEEVERLGA